MGRAYRVDVGDTVYHVLNRANFRSTLFNRDKQYQRFLDILKEALVLVPMRILSYCLMPNHWHLVLYLNYQGQEITNLILVRAALFDAIFTTILALPFIFISFFRQRLWLAPILATLFAISLELFALQTGRWAYAAAMPIIPIINTGLTPTIQLGILAFISFKVGFKCQI